MAKPPPPPERQTSELDEVERAISVLGGRHPEHEKTRRETLAAAQQRKKALDRELAANERGRRWRAVAWTASALVLGGAGFFGWRLAARASRVREAIAQDEARFVAQGAEELAENHLTGSRTLTAQTPASSCLFALATAGKVVVRAGASTLTGGRSLGFCTCSGGPVTLEASGTEDAPTGLALLRIDGKVAGGPLARAWSPVQPDVWSDPTEAGGGCSEAMLDGWLGDHHWPKPALRGDELATVNGASNLRAAGFRVVTRIAEGTPFAAVDGAAGECGLAVARPWGTGELALRVSGGARPIEHARGVLLWCGSLPASVSVWASGSATSALILAAPASRLGGLLGAREGAREAGYVVGESASWLRPEDQGWEASSILRASTATDIAASTLPSEPGPPDARVAAVVAARGAGVTWEARDPIACDPPLDASSGIAEALCAPASAATLWRKGAAPGCSARGALPLWMATLAQRHEADAVARVPELLTLARRLTREGFEPTTFEGVVETQDGVRVVGRAGEDTVVAVGLAPKPPWVFPYSDGVPWDLGDAPREVPLKPGESVMLVATPHPNVPLEKRRTVVFRHVAQL